MTPPLDLGDYTAKKPEAAVQQPAARPEPAAVTPEPAATRRGRGSAKSKSGRKPTKRPARDPRRASNLALPVSLRDRVEAVRLQEGISQGEILIKAVEMEWNRLQETRGEAPAGVTLVGGTLFDPRPSYVASQALSEGTKVFSFRLFEKDFDKLDELQAELGFTSRVAMAVAALSAYVERREAASDDPANPNQD